MDGEYRSQKKQEIIRDKRGPCSAKNSPVDGSSGSGSSSRGGRGSRGRHFAGTGPGPTPRPPMPTTRGSTPDIYWAIKGVGGLSSTKHKQRGGGGRGDLEPAKNKNIQKKRTSSASNKKETCFVLSDSCSRPSTSIPPSRVALPTASPSTSIADPSSAWWAIAAEGEAASASPLPALSPWVSTSISAVLATSFLHREWGAGERGEGRGSEDKSKGVQLLSSDVTSGSSCQKWGRDKDRPPSAAARYQTQLPSTEIRGTENNRHTRYRANVARL